MTQAIKVLVVERRDCARFVSRRLREKHARELAWQSADSECDLRKIAKDFNPGIVFFADDMAPGCRDAALDLLQLLSLQAEKILVAEVGDGDASPPGDGVRSGVRGGVRSGVRSAAQSAAAAEHETPAAEHPAPAPPWPRPLPCILETSRDAVVLSDAAGWITYANSKACEILGDSAGLHLGTLLGTAYDFASTGRRLHRLGYFDAATALPCPVHTSDLASRVLARAREPSAALPVTALELSGLRLIAETGRHAVSDAVLDVITGELRSRAVGCGMVARLGADDVLVVLPDPSHPSDAAVTVRGEGRAAAGRAAAGRAQPPPVAANPMPVKPQASLLDAGLEHVDVGLEQALNRQTIGVHYQPQYDLASGRGCGVQALARWFLTTGEVIAPAQFIPVAERGGMIGALGAHVLKSACDRLAAWRGRDMEHLTVSVNVSNLQIADSFAAVVAGILKTSGVAASRLELEIAESALPAQRETTIRCLRQWKELGVRIAMNHSGKDCSSLGYLAKIPVDRLILDRALIQRMTSNENDAGMVRSLIKLGEVHEIAVLAQGVETEAQLKLLRQFGCPQAQGFLLARPMSGVHALLALRKPWGNLAKPAVRAPPGPPAPIGSARL